MTQLYEQYETEFGDTISIFRTGNRGILYVNDGIEPIHDVKLFDGDFNAAYRKYNDIVSSYVIVQA